MSTAVRTDRTGTELLGRSLAYRTLSQALAYPTAGSIGHLREEDLPLVLGVLPSLPAEVRRGFRSVARAFEDAEIASLESAYRDVFTHVHSADCPMYETDHGPRDIWRQSSILVDIAGFYRAFGVAERGERPDHVAVELEFLHVVTYKEAWARAHDDPANARVCRDAEVSFLRDHALRWIPAFAARVQALAARGPYAAVARTTERLLRAEADRHGLAIPAEAVPEPGPSPGPDAAPSLCEVEP